MDFCLVPHGNIDYRITGKQKVAQFVEEAHAPGLKAALVTGDGHWASDALKHIPERICDELVVYNSLTDEKEQCQAHNSFVVIVASYKPELDYLGTSTL